MIEQHSRRGRAKGPSQPTGLVGPQLRRAAALLALVLFGLGFGPALAQEDPILRTRQLRVGLVSDGDRDRMALRLAPFRLSLARTTGLKVETVLFDNGQSLLDATAARRVDYAVLSATGFAMAYAFCRCVEPIAVPRAVDGSDGWHAIMVVRAADAAQSLGDLAGRSLALDRQSVAGWFVPNLQLAAEGLDLKKHFGRLIEVRSAAEAVARVLSGEADAAMAWSSLTGADQTGFTRGTLHDLAATGQIDPARLRVIWRSTKIPHGPHVVRADMPSPIRTKIRDLLLTLSDLDPEAYDAVERTFGGGFAATELSDFQKLIDGLTPKPLPGDIRP